MTQLTAKLKPRCVGRFLIYLPADALTSGNTKIHGVRVEAQAMSQIAYQAAMDARSVELKATKSSLGYRFLYADGEIEGVKGSRYFISLRHADDPSDGRRVIKAYKWDRGYQIELQIEGFDDTHSIYKDTPSYKMNPVKTDVREKMSRVVSILDRARGRADDDIPTEPGLCFLGGFLPGKATAEEEISVSFLLHDMHDVGFRLDTDSSISEPTTLLQRGSDIEASLKASDGRTIRKGRVDLHGMQAEEWLTEGLTPAKARGHYFVLEANSKIGSALTPLVRLDIDNGGRLPSIDGDRKLTQASLSEGEAIALWDAVSRTLRPRPNAF